MATVALAEVAGAIKDGLLAIASATGLVVIHQMMAAELTEAIGEKHAKIAAQEHVGTRSSPQVWRTETKTKVRSRHGWNGCVTQQCVLDRRNQVLLTADANAFAECFVGTVRRGVSTAC